MRTLGLIPARGGSKGLPGKNVRMLGGKPLLAWTVEVARQCEALDGLIVSTDDPAIADVAHSLGCDVPYTRPSNLSGDETPIVEVAIHALDQLSDTYDCLVLLQPTSPFRTVSDVNACIRACTDDGASGCISVVRALESPYWMFIRDSSQNLRSLFPYNQIPTRRQELPVAFFPNGSVYAAQCDWLRKFRSFLGPGVQGYEMPQCRSVDIDTLADFERAERLLSESEEIL